MSLNPPPPDPCAEQIGYPLKNGEPEADDFFGTCPAWLFPLVGWQCKSASAGLLTVVIPTCTAAMSIVISHNSPLHNSLPTLSLGFILFFSHHLIAGLQKGPFSPMFPQVSFSPWACFPLFFFHHHIYFWAGPLVLLHLSNTTQLSTIRTARNTSLFPQPTPWVSKRLPTMGSLSPRLNSRVLNRPFKTALLRSPCTPRASIHRSLG